MSNKKDRVKIPESALFIKPEILCQLMFYAQHVPKEVGGFGIATIHKAENYIEVDEVFLMYQETDETECILKSRAISLMYDEMVSQGKDCGSVNFWWHSHDTMSSFFSGQDNETLEDWPGDYLIGLVINKKMEFKCKIMTKVPVQMMCEIPVYIMWGGSENALAWKEEIKNKVIDKPKPEISNKVVKYKKKQERKYKPLNEMTEEEFQEFQDGFYTNYMSHEGNENSLDIPTVVIPDDEDWD